ncbi:DUF4386 domain-containing protein, partial [bacterium]|nr:DUF4386 domain-containing protein [bacterium]
MRVYSRMDTELNNHKNEISPILYARICGVLFLIMVITGIFSMAYVPGQIVVDGNPAETANNLIANRTLFQMGIVSHLIVLFVDLMVALLLYLILKPVNKTIAMIAAGFRVVMVAIRGANLINYFLILGLVSGRGFLIGFSEPQSNSLVHLFLE